MHGPHPFPGPTQLWWGARDRQDSPRNLFGAPTPDRMFRAGGLIDANGRVTDRAALHALMKDLAERIRREQDFRSELGGATDNPNLPSGYTYLLQFIAHDMVDSVASLSLGGAILGPGSRNARSEPLLLDTLYGAGPDECPQAYEHMIPTLEHVPRTRLRLGPEGKTRPPGIKYCPFRDIARSQPNSHDEGFAGGSALLAEAMVADPRNDSHVLISQLTVLFQLLHNHVLSIVENALPVEGTLPRRELAYRQFHCARLAVTLIYRNIIEKDVLRRILDRRIFERYASNHTPLLNAAQSVPLEFTFGAFRFGHAIARDNYNINSASTQQQPLSTALQLSSARARQLTSGNLPINRLWHVDWAFFFFDTEEPVRQTDTGLDRRNFSRKIGPNYPKSLEDEVAPPPKTEFDAGGLAHLDLLSSCYAGVMSVPTLCRELRDKGFTEVEGFEEWRGRLARWLTERGGQFEAGAQSTERVVNDPPLPFFVLFEAAEAARGERLGPLGSIIVAEAILGAMRRRQLGVEEGPTLKQRLARCGSLLFDRQPEVARDLSKVDEIQSMPELLEYMERQGLFRDRLTGARPPLGPQHRRES